MLDDDSFFIVGQLPVEGDRHGSGAHEIRAVESMQVKMWLGAIPRIPATAKGLADSDLLSVLYRDTGLL